MWEFYVLAELSRRLDSTNAVRVISPLAFYEYADRSALLTPFGAQGTLQDAINVHLKGGKKMEEPLVLYYAIEVARTVQAIHRAGVIHCDLKPDNWLVKSGDADEAWDHWQRGGQLGAGWDGKGLTLIDFGMAIDTTLYPVGTVYGGDCKTSKFSCPHMEDGLTWTWEADLYAMAGVFHCMLFGEYMTVGPSEDGSIGPGGRPVLRPRTPFKRYWNVSLWEWVFDQLLNPGPFFLFVIWNSGKSGNQKGEGVLPVLFLNFACVV